MNEPQLMKAGAVITVRAPNSHELELGIILAVTGRELDVAAVSEEFQRATDHHPILDANVAGFTAAVFPEAHGLVLPEQCGEILGTATPEDQSLWTGVGLATGPPILAPTDPRSAFAAELSDRWTPYWEPVISLRATRTFGELVARARTLLNVEEKSISTEVGGNPTSVAALERDDPQAFLAIGPRQLAALLKKLPLIFGIEAQARLRTALMSRALPGMEHAVAHRSGRASGQVGAARRDADRYVSAVCSHLHD